MKIFLRIWVFQKKKKRKSRDEEKKRLSVTLSSTVKLLRWPLWHFCAYFVVVFTFLFWILYNKQWTNTKRIIYKFRLSVVARVFSLSLLHVNFQWILNENAKIEKKRKIKNKSSGSEYNLIPLFIALSSVEIQFNVFSGEWCVRFGHMEN